MLICSDVFFHFSAADQSARRSGVQGQDFSQPDGFIMFSVCPSAYLSSLSTCGSVSDALSWHSVCALQSFVFDPRFSLCSAVRGGDGSSCLPAGTIVVFCFTKHSLGIRAGLVWGGGRINFYVQWRQKEMLIILPVVEMISKQDKLKQECTNWNKCSLIRWGNI